MSVKLMSAVWDLAIEPTPKLLLLKLADFGHDDGGNIFPGVETLRRAAGVASGSTVKRRLRQLKALGILTEDEERQAKRRTTGRGNYKIWRLDIDAARRHFPRTNEGVSPPNLTELARAAESKKRVTDAPLCGSEKGVHPGPKRGSSRTEKGVSMSPPNH